MESTVSSEAAPAAAPSEAAPAAAAPSNAAPAAAAPSGAPAAAPKRVQLPERPLEVIEPAAGPHSDRKHVPEAAEPCGSSSARGVSGHGTLSRKATCRNFVRRGSGRDFAAELGGKPLRHTVLNAPYQPKAKRNARNSPEPDQLEDKAPHRRWSLSEWRRWGICRVHLVLAAVSVVFG